MGLIPPLCMNRYKFTIFRRLGRNDLLMHWLISVISGYNGNIFY